MDPQPSNRSAMELIIPPVAKSIPDGADCGACSASCQSACKTSCTVGNQPCTALLSGERPV